jgi:metallo-beta-lactamase class B
VKFKHSLVLGAVLLVPVAQPSPGLEPDPPKACSMCEAWNRPREPFRLFGNSYYVGVAGLSSVLITSDEGHVLIDGALPQSAPLIDANIRAVGFRTADIRLILSSHEHYDHAGGIAALQRASGATVAASPLAARALESGGALPEDPQFGFGVEANAFPRVDKVRVANDGETMRVGPLAVKAHFTPGHTPGATTWTWRSCEGAICRDLVYADSLTAVAAPGFQYSRDPALVATFRRSIATLEALPCDVLLSLHPEFVQIDEKLARRKTDPATNPLIDRQACRTYAAMATRRLDDRLAEERGGR